MYGKRRRSTRPATELTEERRADLVGNCLALVGDPEHVFASVAERRACWFANRSLLIHAQNPGTRPAAWWAFEAKTAPDLHRSSDQQLWALGELTPKEREQFEAWWLRSGRSLEDIPPANYQAPDPRTVDYE